jgi:CCR4-NOT complex subunit CAF16
LALDDLHFSLAPGERCLLLGRNGAGKSTLLHVIGGKHMVPDDKVLVLGRPAFHDTSLAAHVTFLGGPFPFDVDITVGEVLVRTPHVDRAREARLVEVLGVDRDWHMHRVSDGQRRRVQILLGLLNPCAVLLLDEVTTDLDLIARQDLLNFLRDDVETRGGTILYATHILDGLEEWATHVAMIHRGRMVRHQALSEVPELADLRSRGTTSPLLRFVEAWLRDPR